MITTHNLKHSKLAAMSDYYEEVAQMYSEGKINASRGRFKALSKKQRKELLVYIAEKWQASPGDSMYDYFFEIF
jgi:hypothetical protein